jgi:TPR repeat protein
MLWREQQEAREDAQAAFDLGLIYDQGRQVPQDFTKALEWYRRAAELGHPSGAFNGAVMYDSGKGVPADHAEAARGYELAAQRGSPRAQYNLALLYEHGDGVPRDIPRAIAPAANGITATRARLGLLTTHPPR